MHKVIPCTVFIAMFVMMTVPTPSACLDISSRYATIHYEKEELLREFNKEILLGSLSYNMRFKKSITWQDEVKNKVDVIVERVVVQLDILDEMNLN